MPSRQHLEQIYRQWIQALNDSDTNTLSDLTADVVVRDGVNLSRQEYILDMEEGLKSASIDRIELDMLTVDVKSQAVAARLILIGTPKKPYMGITPTGRAMEWTEYILTWFNAEDKIAAVKILVDMEALRSGTAGVTRTPDLTLDPPPHGFNLETMYRSYINAINTRTTEENLPKLCQPVITHNLQESTLEEYRAFVDAGFELVENFRLTVIDLITDEASQQVAARIKLSGKPVAEFMGVAPTGEEMEFSEHAFYKLSGGKIAYVWALRDMDSLRSCLQREG